MRRHVSEIKRILLGTSPKISFLDIWKILTSSFENSLFFPLNGFDLLELTLLFIIKSSQMFQMAISAEIVLRWASSMLLVLVLKIFLLVWVPSHLGMTSVWMRMRIILIMILFMSAPVESHFIWWTLLHHQLIIKLPVFSGKTLWRRIPLRFIELPRWLTFHYLVRP